MKPSEDSFLAALEAPSSASAAGDPDPDALQAAVRLMRTHPFIDVHAHPGRFFASPGLAMHPSFAGLLTRDPKRVLEDMRAGHVAAAAFSTVGDLPALGYEKGKGISAMRTMPPGEAYASHRLQAEQLRKLTDAGLVHPILTPADLHHAWTHGRVGALHAVEGADFLEGDADRIEEACATGVRIVTLVHYRVSEIGDIQTEPARHNGLTPFGRTVVRELDRAAIVIDLAHATEQVCAQVAALTDRPLLISHTHLQPAGNGNARLISEDHARLIADTDGVIGVWPAGLFLRDLNDYVEQILRLVASVGVRHVAIGSDMDTNYRPVFHNYRQAPLITAALRSRGMTEEEVTAIIGGNFLRLFAAYTKQDLEVQSWSEPGSI